MPSNEGSPTYQPGMPSNEGSPTYQPGMPRHAGGHAAHHDIQTNGSHASHPSMPRNDGHPDSHPLASRNKTSHDPHPLAPTNEGSPASLPLPPGEGWGEGGDNTARPIAAPAVRQRALELDIDLKQVRGTGPAGRITQADLDKAAAQASSSNGTGTPPATGDARCARLTHEETLPVIGLRRKIAQKMQEAKRRIPHFTYVEEIDVTELEAPARSA
jgi:pyruvate/2-oxoglutarate dehydrogenase complex dihydrolipoamide acyltransferase (E2) component